MFVDVRSTGKLLGSTSVDVPGHLAPIIDTLRTGSDEDPLDLSRLRITCDWIQYRGNFRGIVDGRRIEPSTLDPALGALEVAVDLRRCDHVQLAEITRDALRRSTDATARLYLEPWTVATTSYIWDFNALFWRALAIWEKSAGNLYEQALPDGASDVRNVEATRELIGEMFAVWDDLGARGELPDELFVLELGVGNGNQAKTWLDELAAMSSELDRDYYARIRYLMCDYSEHVLDLARAATAEHSAHVSTVALDAEAPSRSLSFLREKLFLVSISSVYDNLPSEEIARIDGQTYRSEVRAYLPAEVGRALADRTGIPVTELSRVIQRLVRLGPELLAEAMPDQFAGVDAVAVFWQEVWAALKLEERYVLVDLDTYQLAPGVTGHPLKTLLEGVGDMRVHASNAAAANLAEMLPLLHRSGRLQCHDIFVTDLADYRTAFRGPGKHDGSVVNWVNGRLLTGVADVLGYEVRFAPFAHRTGTNFTTLIATRRT